jgi:hypothetical protein
VTGALRSFVTAFLSAFPFWIRQESTASGLCGCRGGGRPGAGGGGVIPPPSFGGGPGGGGGGGGGGGIPIDWGVDAINVVQLTVSSVFLGFSHGADSCASKRSLNPYGRALEIREVLDLNSTDDKSKLTFDFVPDPWNDGKELEVREDGMTSEERDLDEERSNAKELTDAVYEVCVQDNVNGSYFPSSPSNSMTTHDLKPICERYFCEKFYDMI